MTIAADSPALLAAKQAQERINAALDGGRSFRLEAGAGAGKTYSLLAALKRLIAARGPALVQAGQKVACITFTEVARNEIAQEIEDHPAILVETIHAFSWSFLGQFQNALRDIVKATENYKEKIEQGGGVATKRVEYDFGFFGVGADTISLSHDDIPRIMAELLAREKFRRLLVQQFPIIFIDEYQDTDRGFMNAITENFLKSGDGPLIGLFGDHWQTIYRSEYELADYPIEGIDKGSNFRSVPAVVNVLNQLRPDFPQAVSDPDAVGEARFFHANSYSGARTNESHSKGDLHPDLARATRQALFARLESEGWDRSKTKILMLTHNVLAAEQGYPKIVEVFDGRNELFVKKEDPTIKFFAEVIEPVCSAYSGSRYGEMFKLLGSAPSIQRQSDKAAWRQDMDKLQLLRITGTIGAVIDHLKATKRPSPPDRVLRRDDELVVLAGQDFPEDAPTALRRYKELRDVRYTEVIEVVKFIERKTPFATQHSVKGAEFENVLVVLGGGWNHYNWPQLLELIETKALTGKNTKGYYRARNLFYVSVSRPMKRLAVLATQQMSDAALATAQRLFGSANVEALTIGSAHPV